VPKVIQSGGFFVVGGPVQPDRACYIERRADEQLIESIADQQFSYLLSPRASGKSSLMARTIRRLRREGQLAAVVDLAQIGARGDSDDAGRWYYSIAYRVVRELRLKIDLQSWWQDNSALSSEQRFVEFFWEIVLANTTERVTVFFDEVERAIGLPFATDLFSAMHSCYARRITEPDFARLNFVVLGIATPKQLCADASLSPFVDGRAIDLADFSVQECYGLVAGLGVNEELGHGLMDRIFLWTHGQPYLTQKVTRAVARKGSKLADVERIVHEQFLAPGVSQEEPLLNHIRALFSTHAPGSRRALSLLAKISKRAVMSAEVDSTSRDLLRLAGVVSESDDERLMFRNRIYERVFDARWASSALPINWRGSVSFAAAIGVIVLLPLWYTQVLPRPYISTLRVVTQDYAVAEDAYQRLHRLPGFAATADRLLAEAMTRRSESAQTFEQVMAADTVLRGLPERADLADGLLGEYWLRRSQDAANSEQRDIALLYAIQARDGRPDAVREVAAELIGSDYRRLMRSFRLAEVPIGWQIDWDRGELVVIDAAHRVRHLSLAENTATRASEVVGTVERTPGRLTALQHVPVSRELTVDEVGAAGGFNLLLTLQHSKVSDLLVTLTAPSGAQATLVMPQPRADQQDLRFSARSGSPLAALAGEEKQGLWRLTVVDRRSDEVGLLLSWGLQFAAQRTVWQDVPEQGVPLPDPVRTDQVEVQLSDDGRIALAQPTRLGATGALAVWNLVDGELINDLPIESVPEHVLLSSDPARAIVVTDDELTVWDVEGDVPTARFVARTEFLGPPALSIDGAFILVAEQANFSSPLFSLLSVDDGEVLASFEGVAGLHDWVLGPQARYAALLTANRRVRIVDPRGGRELLELRHQRQIERLVALPDENLVVSVDSGGDIYAWRLGLTESGPASIESWYLGTTTSASSDSVAINAGILAYEASQGYVEARDLNGEYRPHQLRLDGYEPTVASRISPDAARLVTANGTLFRLWRLDGWQAGPMDLDQTALAVDAGGLTAALGFRGGHVRRRDVSDFGRRGSQAVGVDFIGHRGTVTSLAINVSRNIIVSGGADGVVRIWDLATVAPNQHFLRHPAGPIHAVDISRDGRWIVSAAEYSARVWGVDNGELLGEIPVNGAALAVAFAAHGELVAVGDSAGNIFFGVPRGSEPLLSSRAQAAVQSVSFSPDMRVLATGDSEGYLQLWDVATAAPLGEAHSFGHAVSWIAFSEDGEFLFVRSGHWIHRLQLGSDGPTVVATRLVGMGLETNVILTGTRDEYLRLIGGAAEAQASFYDIALNEAVLEPLPPASPQLSRNWPSILGLTVDSDGNARISP